MKKLPGYLIALGIFTFATLAAMRLATVLDPYSAQGIALADFPSALLSDPFGINFKSTFVTTVGVAVFVFACLWAALVAHAQKNRYGESGKQYGEERMADEKEMQAFCDTRDFANNIWFTKHCGLLLSARNKRQKRAQYAVNLNTVVYATSGTGKTFNCTKPSFLQSAGDHLRPVKCGVLRVFEHLLPSKAKTKDAEKKAGKKARKAINEGFDVFNTDPKGDNVRDVGPMYEAAGYDIKCFNTIDPGASLHYNPFAYIASHLVDVKDADDVACTVSLTLDGKGEDGTSRKLEGPSSLTVSTAHAGRLAASMSVSQVAKTRAQMTEEIADEKARERAREDEKWVEGALGEHVSEVVMGHAYRRSSVTLTVAWYNTDWKEHSPELEIKLDPALEVVSLPFDAEHDPDANRIVWRPDSVAPRPKNAPDELAPCACATFETRMRSMRVPDGVSLAKNVNCMCKNLNEDVQTSGDMKFWEDTKQLAFMSYVAFLFEKYGPEHRNIPEMMRLLNMAVVEDDPSALSELDILMEAWETGWIFLPDEDEEKATSRSLRDKHKTGSWKPTGHGAHDRSRSLAIHCYKAYNVGATETRQSILASCQAAMVRMVPEEIKELVRYDEMRLDTLGEAGQRQVIFAIPDAVDDTYSFLFALMTYQAMSLFCDRAVRKHAGRAPRHVRFEIDEAGTIGKITTLDRIIAVIRSFNGSIALYFQSKAQAVKTYGKEGADIIIDCCTTTLFMGSQQEDTLNMIEAMLGEETVTSSTLSRTFSACGFTQNASEQVSANARKVRSKAQLRREDKFKMLAFVMGMRPVLDDKFPTQNHPLYCYIDPTSPRSLTQPVCRVDKRFEYQEYLARRRESKEVQNHR